MFLFLFRENPKEFNSKDQTEKQLKKGKKQKVQTEPAPSGMMGWKGQDMFVYAVESKKITSSPSHLEFVIYIPIHTTVKWNKPKDKSEKTR